MKNLEWNFDTEHEAAYAYNVASVIAAIGQGEDPRLLELNMGMELTQAQIIHVETEVCKTMRKEIGLPKDYKFPRVIKSFLEESYTVKKLEG